MEIFIPLYNKTVIIDDEDYEIFKKYKYHITGGYLRINNGPDFHRILLPYKDGLQVDHINGNKLDNRRCNLRYCTKAQNCANRIKPDKRKRHSKYKGVTKYKNVKKFYACIRHKGFLINIGKYETEEEAARAYDSMATTLCGEFAILNFPKVSELVTTSN